MSVAEQYDLFEARKLARKTDPETSHEAARGMVETGKLGQAQVEVLSLVRRCPGLGAREYATKAGTGDVRTVNRRLPELEAKGLVVRRGTKKCPMTGRAVARWWPRGIR